MCDSARSDKTTPPPTSTLKIHLCFFSFSFSVRSAVTNTHRSAATPRLLGATWVLQWLRGADVPENRECVTLTAEGGSHIFIQRREANAPFCECVGGGGSSFLRYYGLFEAAASVLTKMFIISHSHHISKKRRPTCSQNLLDDAVDGHLPRRGLNQTPCGPCTLIF